MKPTRAGLCSFPVLFISLCVACQPSGSGEPEPVELGAKALPPIHAVLHWENFMAGKNQARLAYQARVAACENAGIPTQPLNAADVARLDTGTVEIMIDSDRQTVRQTTWTLGSDESDYSVAGTCRLRLVEKVYEGQADGDFAFGPIETKPPTVYPEWTFLGEDSIGGQSCNRWRKSMDAGAPEEICVWSEGRQWGFRDYPVTVAGCTVTSPMGYLNSIPLQAHPLKGSGCILKVQSFSVGKGSLPASAAAGTVGTP